MSENHSGNNSSEASDGKTKGLFGETDRASGEYRFRSGYTQQVYSNAHFVPLNESTMPPKYYRPSEKKADFETDEGMDRNSKKTSRGILTFFAICFICAVLGGVAGALLTLRICSYQMDGVMITESETPSEVPEADETILAGEQRMLETVPLSAAEVYQLAREQVVSITVETVRIDYFGYRTPTSVSGSGFIISEDGYILTNYHVVEAAAEGGFNVTVSLADGSVYIGKITGTERESDLAVIKIDRDGLYPVAFGNSDEITVGDEIFAVGNPYGILDYSMTIGHISALNRRIATEEDEESRNMFQIDAAVYSGNSGGPIFDQYGKVIGIVTARYASSGMEGIGFAIPINDAIPVAYELLDKGYVSGKASLGVSFDERYSSVYSRYYHLPEGAYIYAVMTGSCAEKAGLQAGDILMQIGDWKISNSADVTNTLKSYKAGDSASVTIYRGGAVYSATVIFDEAIPSHIMESQSDESAEITTA